MFLPWEGSLTCKLILKEVYVNETRKMEVRMLSVHPCEEKLNYQVYLRGEGQYLWCSFQWHHDAGRSFGIFLNQARCVKKRPLLQPYNQAGKKVEPSEDLLFSRLWIFAVNLRTTEERMRGHNACLSGEESQWVIDKANLKSQDVIMPACCRMFTLSFTSSEFFNVDNSNTKYFSIGLAHITAARSKVSRSSTW